jgi:hypothetical protein
VNQNKTKIKTLVCLSEFSDGCRTSVGLGNKPNPPRVVAASKHSICLESSSNMVRKKKIVSLGV